MIKIPKYQKGTTQLTLILVLACGTTANNSIANIMVTKACHEVGNLDARQTDANMLAFSDGDLEILKIKREIPGELKNVPLFDSKKQNNKILRLSESTAKFINLKLTLNLPCI